MAVATEREYGLFINGELVEPGAGDVRDLIEPATGEPLGRAAMGGEAEIDRGLETLDLYLETKSVIDSTSPKPINPFGL
jgi:acyl-CoA reductase-like NAD-dependent aldehyde dehydrogenase